MMLSAYTIEETRQIWEKGSAWTGTDDEFAASAEEYLWGMIKSRVNRGFMTQDAAKHWTEKLYRSCFLPTFHSGRSLGSRSKYSVLATSQKPARSRPRGL